MLPYCTHEQTFFQNSAMLAVKTYLLYYFMSELLSIKFFITRFFRRNMEVLRLRASLHGTMFWREER